MVEVTLAPRSSMAGGVLRQLHFRERLGVQVLAIWRGGRAYRSNLRDMTLEFGDAFLVMGSRDRLAMLQDERDLLVLTPVVKDVFRTEKAPWAALIMAAVLVPVLFGWLPIAVSAVCGVVLMVLAGCLKMDEAYRAIEWRAVFLIAGMIPLGAAMQDSGAASFLAEGVVGFLGPLGPWPVIVGLYVITAVATTIIPTAALVLLMAPITIQTCTELGVSPLTGMMAIAMAASASFTSPISHPANILVMGPGGYRFVDYLKLGIPAGPGGFPGRFCRAAHFLAPPSVNFRGATSRINCGLCCSARPALTLAVAESLTSGHLQAAIGARVRCFRLLWAG